MPRRTSLALACCGLVAAFCGIGACRGADERAADSRPAQWVTYESDWFSVRYPEEFAVRPSLPSGAGGYDSVFFDAPDASASFYVLSPQWGRKATDIQLRPEERELSVEETETELGSRIVRRIAAAGRERIVEETIEQGGSVYWVTAFEFRDEAARRHYAEAYERFKGSLQQFAD